MAPTEATILSTFLLPPASLPSTITLKAFTELFPRSQQSSPEIRTLYRDLQHQRAKTSDLVTRNIAAEVKRGNSQRRAVVRVRRVAERDENDDEIDIETALFGQTSNLPSSKPHTLVSILPEIERATEDIEDEIQKIEDESALALTDLRDVVGGLSDLRYGKMANPQLQDQVLEGLARLGNSCNQI